VFPGLLSGGGGCVLEPVRPSGYETYALAADSAWKLAFRRVGSGCVFPAVPFPGVYPSAGTWMVRVRRSGGLGFKLVFDGSSDPRRDRSVIGVSGGSDLLEGVGRKPYRNQLSQFRLTAPRCKVRAVGLVDPRSIRLMSPWSIPHRCANSAWVSPCCSRKATTCKPAHRHMCAHPPTSPPTP